MGKRAARLTEADIRRAIRSVEEGAPIEDAGDAATPAFRALISSPVGIIAGRRPSPRMTMAFISTASGKAAGVPGSAHGLRKLGATRLANAGASVHELQAVFGWESGRMAEVYTKEADRIRLARQAMKKLKTRTSIRAPDRARE